VAFLHDTEPLEQHDNNINAVVARSGHPAAQQLEIGRVELAQVEFRFAVQGLARAAALVGQGSVTVGDLAVAVERGGVFPGPETETIVMALFQEAQIIIEIHHRVGSA